MTMMTMNKMMRMVINIKVILDMREAAEDLILQFCELRPQGPDHQCYLLKVSWTIG